MFAAGNQAAIHAKSISGLPPTVFVIGDDPVSLGLASSFNRPTDNMTGITFYSVELAAKRLEFLHELVPPDAPIAVLFHSATPSVSVQRPILEKASAVLGRQLIFFEVSSAADLDGAFEKLKSRNIGGFIYNTDPFFNFERNRLTRLAERLRVPAVYSGREYVQVGGLMSYGSQQTDAYRLGGEYVARVLKGERPSDLPIMQASRFELVLSIRTAREQGISFTARQLALADEVIE